MAGSFDDAIRRQHFAFRRRLAAGMPRAGWKICVNDRAMQTRLGIDSSFVGFLDGERRLRSGGGWKVESGSILGVEPEIAVHFESAVAAGDGSDAIRAAIGGVAPAIEIVEWKNARLELEALAEGSSFHAGFVVGNQRSLDDVPEIGPSCPRFVRGADVLGAPDPDLVPRDLTALVAFVASFLARYGERIEQGDWLLCGACTSPARVAAGDSIEADFGSLGKVSVRFE